MTIFTPDAIVYLWVHKSEMLFMTKNIAKVGIREFRAHLPEYLMTTIPVAITRHGETIGFYIPTRHHPDKADIDALKEAAIKLEKLLQAKGITEEELLADFRALRKKK